MYLLLNMIEYDNEENLFIKTKNCYHLHHLNVLAFQAILYLSSLIFFLYFLKL